jgi:hypothetical protein
MRIRNPACQGVKRRQHGTCGGSFLAGTLEAEHVVDEILAAGLGEKVAQQLRLRPGQLFVVR